VAKDPVALALAHGLCLREAQKRYAPGKDDGGQEGHGKGFQGKGVRSRARELPGLIASAGLAQALLFYLSKADDNEYRKAYLLAQAAEKDVCQLPEGLNNDDVRKMLEDKEGAGYGTILALLAHAIKTLTPAGSYDFRTRDGLAQYILYLAKEGRGTELQATALLQPYLEALKRVIEAFFGGEK